MARQSGLWFRSDNGWWMTTVRGERVRLAQGRENKKAAEQKFHELMATRVEAPESLNARVADVIEGSSVGPKSSSPTRPTATISGSGSSLPNTRAACGSRN